MKLVFLFQILFTLAILALGTFCVNYDLGVILHKHIPTIWAFGLNLFTGNLSITVAIVLKVLKLLGVIAA